MRNEIIIREYHKIMKKALDKIRKTEKIINAHRGKKSEDLAENYYTKKGYIVYRSRVRKGYRIIGVKYYWKEYEDQLTKDEIGIIQKIQDILKEKDFKELANLVRDKNGCPDLLLVKGKKIKFVEVKTNSEEIKSSTLEWFMRNKKYPFSILRVKHSN